MATIALSGNDTLVLNNRAFADFADGDAAMITFPNQIAEVKTGKNGNALFALNSSGRQAELKLRLIRGAADDKFLNGLMAAQDSNFEGTVLMIGQFVKKLGDGAGNVGQDTYIVSGGVFVKRIEVKMNVEGDTNQSVSEYNIKFSQAARVIT